MGLIRHFKELTNGANIGFKGGGISIQVICVVFQLNIQNNFTNRLTSVVVI